MQVIKSVTGDYGTYKVVDEGDRFYVTNDNFPIDSYATIEAAIKAARRAACNGY